jgi:crossover junction endodeoxyribonuclease RuvC
VIVLGVDPGLKGGIAALDGDSARVWDFPVIERRVGRKIKRRIDSALLARLIGNEVLTNYCAPEDAIVFIERAQATPQMGVSSAFAYGECFGLAVGVLAHLDVPIRYVSPVVWKRDMGLGKKGSRLIGRDDERDKAPAIQLARKLYPALLEQLSHSKHDGRAEALLIAHWGVEQLDE